MWLILWCPNQIAFYQAGDSTPSSDRECLWLTATPFSRELPTIDCSHLTCEVITFPSTTVFSQCLLGGGVLQTIGPFASRGYNSVVWLMLQIPYLWIRPDKTLPETISLLGSFLFPSPLLSLPYSFLLKHTHSRYHVHPKSSLHSTSREPRRQPKRLT